jgi:hypothetical protein
LRSRDHGPFFKADRPAGNLEFDREIPQSVRLVEGLAEVRRALFGLCKSWTAAMIFRLEYGRDPAFVDVTTIVHSL